LIATSAQRERSAIAPRVTRRTGSFQRPAPATTAKGGTSAAAAKTAVQRAMRVLPAFPPAGSVGTLMFDAS
jgi:hypothetical protein